MGFLSDLFGGSGGADNTGDELRRQEEERQRRIREGTNAINEIFGGPLYGELPTPAPAPGVGALPEIRPLPGQAKTLFPAPTDTRATLPQPEKIRYIPDVGGGATKKYGKVGEAPGQFGEDWFSGIEQNYLDYYMPQLERQADDAERLQRINLARSGNLTGSVGARQTADLAESKEAQRRRLVDESLKYGSGQRLDLENTRGNLVSQLESGAGIDNVAAQAAAKARALTAPPAFTPLGDLFTKYTAALANSSVAPSASFPGAEEQRRQLLFNIPSSGSNKSGSVSW